MHKQVLRLFDPGVRLYFVVLILFAAVTAYFNYYVAAAEFVLIILLFFIVRAIGRKRQKTVIRYLDQMTAQVGGTTRENVISFPLPIVVIRLESGIIVWGNDSFRAITDHREHILDTSLSALVPGFSTKWLIEGHEECPQDVPLGGRLYKVRGTVMHSEPRNALLASLVWVDCTELVSLQRERALSRLVVAVVLLDNYDECLKNTSDSQKSSFLAAIDEHVSAWARPAGGILRKFDRDKYLFLFEERFLRQFIEGKFAVLESVRSVKGADGVAASVSIGVGKNNQNLAEGFSFAQMAIDMALSRGGDQVVVKDRTNFEFYGGRTKGLEKRTKVKSRVMANALSRIMADSSLILIMSHRGCDLDSVGSASGLVCAARKLGLKAHFVIDMETTVATALVRRLQKLEEYSDVFIEPQEAIVMADGNTLLIVVDCNRPDIVESSQLLQSINKIAVIDHHRRSAVYIDTAVLSFHEPYSSSASELVCELLQYICDPGDLLRTEAEALLSGIVLDTKNFTMHTGVRTFEAASYLRGAGADTISVKKLFQIDLGSSVARSDIVRNAQVIRRNIAVAPVDAPVDRTIAAQAADDLLGISGICASFVLFPTEGQIMLSARSLGGINVQMICEKLGGGGHQTIAGAQIRNATLQEAVQKLAAAIELYCQENYIEA